MEFLTTLSVFGFSLPEPFILMALGAALVGLSGVARRLTKRAKETSKKIHQTLQESNSKAANEI